MTLFLPTRLALETAAWLMTFAIHSTGLLLIALAIARVLKHHASRSLLWKCAMLGAFLTTSLQAVTRVPRFTTLIPVTAQSETFVDAPVAVVHQAGRGHAPTHGAAPLHSESLTRGAPATGPTVAESQLAPPPQLRTVSVLAGRVIEAIVVLWLGIAMLLLLRLYARYRGLHSRVRNRTQVTDPSICELLASIPRFSGVTHRITLTASDNCASPMVLSNREICVPGRFIREFDAEQQRVVLAHEVAHIANRDPLWSLISGALGAIFFFQPLLYVAARRLRSASEILADDWAVRITGSRMAMARSLVQVAEWLLTDGSRSAAATVAMASRDSVLLLRVQRLLADRGYAAPSRAGAMIPAVAMLLTVTAAAPRVNCDCPRAPGEFDDEIRQARHETAAAARGNNGAPPLLTSSTDGTGQPTNASIMEDQNMRSNIGLCAAVAGSAILGACTDERSAAPAEIRDSAGVQIIDNRGDLWNRQPVWRLTSAPTLRIGTIGGDTTYEFDNIEGIAVLSDGRIVVTDEGTNAARWFDPQGRFLMRRGRTGSGPGEFEGARQVTRLPNDTVAIVDGGQRRLTLFSKDGSLGPIIEMAGLSTLPAVVQRLASGSWILGSSGITSHAPSERVPAGITRPNGAILRIANDGSRTDTLGIFPNREMEVTPAGRWRPARIAKRMVYSVFGDHVFVGTQDHLGAEVYSADGKLVRSIRAPDVSNVMGAEYESEYRESLLDPFADSSQARRAEARRSVESIPLSRTLPAYGSLLIDESGNLWLGEFSDADGAAPRRYAVFDSAGRFASIVVAPERFTPITITKDRVWGYVTDSLNVQYVTSYGIVR